MKTSWLGIGMMSGTSMDGLDLAACRFWENGDAYRFEIEAAETIPMGEKWYGRISQLMDQGAEIYAKTDVYFGHFIGQSIQSFIDKHQLQPDFVASHGQTIFHQPGKTFTAQIGDGESIVSYLPCLLVSNFRNKDVALGGEGAPLIPLVEKYLFPAYQLFLNLGGFSNVSYQGNGFDVSPANIVLNHLYQAAFPEAETAYDPGGTFAASGQVNETLLSSLNALDFYAQQPPKSLGWEWVLKNILPLISQHEVPVADAMHTFCHHIADQLASAMRWFDQPQAKMLITGGGRHNTFLMNCIETQLTSVRVQIETEAPEEWIDFKEAIGFAFLGLRTLLGKPTVLQSATGARVEAVTGSIHVPPAGQRIL
ncbi:MAG: anhydro-N-acetylmuramic acid kinase [Bacteroidota bacterium]